MAGLGGQAVRYVYGGTIQGVQEWSSSVWFNPITVGVVDQAAMNAANSALSTAFSTHATNIAASLFGPRTTLTYGRLYYYDAGASTASKVSTDHTFAIAGTGGSEVPSECCLVASLRSATPGRSGRGRNYWPLTQNAFDLTGQVGSSTALELSQQYAAFLTAANAASAGVFTSFLAVIASFTKSLMEPIVEVIVDTKADTQRRRGDKIVAVATEVSTV